MFKLTFQKRRVYIVNEFHPGQIYGLEVKKTFFMLNSAEHEIYFANKSQITKNFKFFLAKHS